MIRGCKRHEEGSRFIRGICFLGALKGGFMDDMHASGDFCRDRQKNEIKNRSAQVTLAVSVLYTVTPVMPRDGEREDFLGLENARVIFGECSCKAHSNRLKQGVALIGVRCCSSWE
jgi:hypothetical protein